MLAVVGIAVLVVAIIALHDPKNTGTPAAVGSNTPAASTTTVRPTPSSSSPTAATTAPPLSLGSSSAAQSQSDTQLRADVPLVVLNNTTIAGLAAEAAQNFENGGWTVSNTGNLTNSIISTCAYYDPSVSDAQAAARALRRQYPTIKRVEPKFSGLVDGPVVVVLTPDYSNG